jgi:hypothetical protein
MVTGNILTLVKEVSERFKVLAYFFGMIGLMYRPKSMTEQLRPGRNTLLICRILLQRSCCKRLWSYWPTREKEKRRKLWRNKNITTHLALRFLKLFNILIFHYSCLVFQSPRFTPTLWISLFLMVLVGIISFPFSCICWWLGLGIRYF